ncbi:hypothetical protein DM02DRAFT_665775 [Periconia macrospinosa]|uniref:Uncharacterized protein n=1 Tax=Periconia macrospinosa TaxID=97972 RepID=A0A2V1EG00_9PLEO|nr:hypothetical protein DM02DRAFT_665775 [Periconia macrospinosa]
MLLAVAEGISIPACVCPSVRSASAGHETASASFPSLASPLPQQPVAFLTATTQSPVPSEVLVDEHAPRNQTIRLCPFRALVLLVVDMLIKLFPQGMKLHPRKQQAVTGGRGQKYAPRRRGGSRRTLQRPLMNGHFDIKGWP